MSQSPFRFDSPIMRVIGRVGDLALLNVLFLLCSLPVVTIGASASALYTVSFQIVRGEDGRIAADFFRAFARNFWQSLAMTAIFLLLGAGLYAGARIIAANIEAYPTLLRVGSWFTALVLLFSASYAFALQARFSNSVWGTLKNSLILSFSHPLRSLVIAALTFFPFALALFGTYYFLLFSAVFILFWFSGAAFVNSSLFERIFKKFLPPAPESKSE